MNRSAPLAWQTPEAHPTLSAHEIHLWHAVIAPDGCHAQWLSAAERARHIAIRNPSLQRRFCSVRCMLRRLLSEYLSCPPAAIDIQVDPAGKPYLPGQAVQFNLSHSHERALFAFGLDMQVGVDLEIERPLKHIPQIAQRVFTPDEYAVLREDGFTSSGFLEFWTRHEARQKCLGRGIFGKRAPDAGIHTRMIRLERAQACVAWSGSGPTPRLRSFTYPPDISLSRL